jgi:hypothetical protein
MDDQRAADRACGGVEQRRRAVGQRDPVRRRIEVGNTLRVDDEVRQVAGVGARRVEQPVLAGERVIVATGGRERWAARPDRVDVDAVETGVRPFTWTLTWTIPVASCTKRAQPIGAPEASMIAALAWLAPPANDWTANAPASAIAAPRTAIPRLIRRMAFTVPSNTRRVIYRVSIYRVTIYTRAMPRMSRARLQSPR